MSMVCVTFLTATLTVRLLHGNLFSVWGVFESYESRGGVDGLLKVLVDIFLVDCLGPG